MKQLLIATSNPGKLNEIRQFLQNFPIKLLSLKDLNITRVFPEHGKTFEENAIQKAQFYSKISGLPALADDGGFEIDALHGEPGVKSHRWIHQDGEDTDEELIAYTLNKLAGIPKEQRGAQLRLVLALVLSDGTVHSIEEHIRGIVAEQPSAHLVPGFPYRSLLFFPEIGKYYDETLTPAEMNRYNHRHKALEKLKPILEKWLES